MDSQVLDSDRFPAPERVVSGARVALEETSWLLDIADQLERNPHECRQALETLETLEPGMRLSIIEELSGLANRPGAAMLLRLLLPDLDRPSTPRLTRCLVTPVDGQGRGSIVVSVSHKNERRTAAFLCDVRLGILDVVGEVESESPNAGGLIDALDQEPESGCACDIPDLALGLLSGSLMLCGRDVPPLVRGWLADTLGTDFQPAGFPAAIPGLDTSTLANAEMPGRAAAVLDACPSWLDASALTFEIAEEISLREGRSPPDPDRDAGAYRFLFEHRLIHCLELYQRMLLWMSWLWKFRDELELSRSALALAGQLLDEQFAVPSNPFTIELTTRSLRAAQHHLRVAAESRTDRPA
jgi:hypothetical protein